jgi:transposase
MGAPVKLARDEYTAQELQRIASDVKDAGQARRVQAISLVMDGWSWARAAAFACLDRQTLRDLVERYNEFGVDGPATLTSRGRPRLPTPSQAEALREVVTNGPDLNRDGVVRWRCVDLVKQSSALFGVREGTMGTWFRGLRLTKADGKAVPPEERRGRAGGIQEELQEHRRRSVTR